MSRISHFISDVHVLGQIIVENLKNRYNIHKIKISLSGWSNDKHVPTSTSGLHKYISIVKGLKVTILVRAKLPTFVYFLCNIIWG